MTRHDRIRHALDAMERAGIVRSWYSYAPGDWRGQRWVVETYGYSRTLFVREVEAFIFGVHAAEAAERALLAA